MHSVAQLCLTLWDPMDCNPPGSSVHGTLQAGILEQVATSFSRGSSQPGDQTQVSRVSCIGRQILYHCTAWEAQPFKIAILCGFFKKYSYPCGPANPLLGIYPEKNMICKDTCTRVFTAALFTVAKTRKQNKCPCTDEWIRKLWCVHTMDYYSATNKRNNSICSNMGGPGDHHTRRSKSEKDKYMVSVIGGIYMYLITEQRQTHRLRE